MHLLLMHRAFAQANQPGGTRHIELGRILVTKGHRMTVVTSSVAYFRAAVDQNVPALPRQEILEPGIDILRCSGGYSGKSFLNRMNEMFGFMTRAFFLGVSVRDVDVVWATSPTLFQALAATLVAKIKRKPLLLEIRDIWPDALVDIGALRNKFAIALSRKLAQWMYAQAKCVVINSPGFRAHLVADGVPDSKIFLVTNGVDVSMFNPEATGEETRIRLGWEGKYVALYSGAHGMANDLDTLLDAAKALIDCPQAIIAFLGDGPEKARLRERAQNMGLRNVQFLDVQPKNEMPDLLAASNACIAHLKPSSMQAMVYPNKVFDYMAAARPTILGIGGVIQEVIEKAGGGVCTKPGDATSLAAAIRQLAQNPAEGKAMGYKGRAYVEAHFNRKVIAESLLATLDLVCIQPAQ